VAKSKARVITSILLRTAIRKGVRNFGDASFEAEVIEIRSPRRFGYLISIRANADCGGGDMPNWDGDKDATQFVDAILFVSMHTAITTVADAETSFWAAVKKCADACSMAVQHG